MCLVPKPRGVSPHDPAVFGANAAVLNHSVALRSSRSGSPTTKGRWVARPVSDRLPVVAGVSGDPLRAWKTVPICQSSVSVRRNPLPTPLDW